MALTQEQKARIFSAADQLAAAGQTPTLTTVRDVLGGGSFSTISPGFSEWKARKALKDLPLREPAPPAVAERLGEFGTEIWAIALELANGRLEKERAALEATRAELEADRQETAEMADQLSAELETLKARASSLEASERATQAQNEALRQQLAATREQAATAEARASENERHADNLNAELARVNAQNTELVKTLAETFKRIERGKSPKKSPEGKSDK